MPENEQSQQIVPKAPFQNTARQRVQDLSSEEMPGFPSVVWKAGRRQVRQGRQLRQRAEVCFTCGGTTKATHGWVMLSWGLTWRSDAHVLLAVHHETSHWLPVGVIGCSLTYWKGAEHFFFSNSQHLFSWHQEDTIPPTPRVINVSSKKRGKHLLRESSEFSSWTNNVLSLGLISVCKFGNEVSKLKS